MPALHSRSSQPQPNRPAAAPQIGQLAAAVGAQPDKLQRVLRLLANLGIFRETRPGGQNDWWLLNASAV